MQFFQFLRHGSDNLIIFALVILFSGGHGAGLTNTVFARKSVTIVEFAMVPHDRAYGQLAMALGMDYWLVPQVSTFYFLRFEKNKCSYVERAHYFFMVGIR